ncbi:MAG: nickel-dependent hydrogenase large subunit [Propionibacteriaceae bacterium]|jgi:hydrogenase large subunit|nr:nickel-dependent hydrogenase large subunit [Propionibacteriaceae bacterium]
MADRVVIDPITRIEGHLRLELETSGGKITDAWSQATQFRGLETILQGRDPRDAWAFTQRICGVCTGVHAITSITAVENAIGSQPPEQALLIRDMIMASQEIQDHVIHFYHLHALDFVNVANAAKADPAAAVAFAEAIGSTWRGNTLTRMTEVRDTVQAILDSGQLSIFTGGYWGHPDYRLPPEADLMAVAHYLDALEFQRSMIRINTVFGGKNPHPHFLVGGMACSIDQNKSETVNQVQVSNIQKWVAECLEFVETCYVPDALAVVGVYKDYFDIGASTPNYLAIGLAGATYGGDPNVVPKFPTAKMDVKPGVIFDDDFSTVHPFDHTKITESIASAWFSYEGGATALTPDLGETAPKYTGPQPPYEARTIAQDDSVLLASREEGWDGKYTWSKEPMYDGKRMQVGPVARVILAYAQGHERMKEIVDGAVATLGISLSQMNSTAGRALARAAECLLSAEILANSTFPKFVENLTQGDINVFDATKWEPSTWDKECSGFGMVEVARGMLSHWVTIKDKAIDRYQCVVPSTWLGGGRDGEGNMSPYEHALAGDGTHPLVDPEQPLEVLRTIHSFDPCMSCAVHVLDEDGKVLQVAQS